MGNPCIGRGVRIAVKSGAASDYPGRSGRRDVRRRALLDRDRELERLAVAGDAQSDARADAREVEPLLKVGDAQRAVVVDRGENVADAGSRPGGGARIVDVVDVDAGPRRAAGARRARQLEDRESEPRGATALLGAERLVEASSRCRIRQRLRFDEQKAMRAAGPTPPGRGTAMPMTRPAMSTSGPP